MSVTAVLPGADWSIEERLRRDRLLSFLFDRINYERLPAGSFVTSDFKLQRMEELLYRLGNPQRGIPVIHIAGTKGKGSTALITAELLQSAGLRVGLFTSPHIHRFEERMMVNGEFPSVSDLEVVLDQLLPVLAEWPVDGSHSPPTFFEICTAMGWLLFRHLRVDAAVVEVGLGGRLDATNVCEPEVCIITSISRDHMHLLGDDLASIAREKAGIIKADVPVVSGVISPEARDVVRQAVADLGCELFELDRDIHVAVEQQTTTSPANPLVRERVTIEYANRRHGGVVMPAPGSHHARNAALALFAVETFLARRPSAAGQIDASAITSTRLALRGEVLSISPLIMVDGAHNEASLQTVLEILAPFPRERRRLVFGVSRDKDARAMLRMLRGQFAHITFTAYQTNPRALPLSELAELAREELAADAWSLADDPRTALAATEASAQADTIICVTGSIFLGAEVREILLSRTAVTLEPLLAGR